MSRDATPQAQSEEDHENRFGELRDLLDSPGSRTEKARRAADWIRSARGYRWVGLYDVHQEEIAIIAWSGPGEPAYPRFPVHQGLCGEAVRSRTPVTVADVTQDPRYLTTFGSTRSEVVVPILDRGRGVAVGVIDVESERVNAFGSEDRNFLERCASLLVDALYRRSLEGGP
jgi:L-methionine (R)-S-oxide reductase